MKNWKEKVQSWAHGGGCGQEWGTNQNKGREAGTGNSQPGLPGMERLPTSEETQTGRGGALNGHQSRSEKDN